MAIEFRQANDPRELRSSGTASRTRLTLEGAFKTRLDSDWLHMMQLGTLDLDRQVSKRVYLWPQPRSAFSGVWEPFREAGNPKVRVFH